MQDPSESELIQSKATAKKNLNSKSSRSDRIGVDAAVSVRLDAPTNSYAAQQKTRLSRIRQLEVYQGAAGVPEVANHEHSDTAGIEEYTLSKGGMLEEPCAGWHEQSA